MKNLIPRLGKRGPHRVLTGELEFAGIPGRVYTPAEGKGIPAVAFGHDWRQSIEAYHATLRHLASWGIAVAAPNTERGFAPNARGFASDLETSLQILAGVKLGQGNISVDPTKLFLAGHGFGASSAVLAATGRTASHKGVKTYENQALLAGVVAIYPSDTSPSSYEAAKYVEAPGLVLNAGAIGEIPMGDATRMAAQWKGDVVYRRLERATAQGFNEKITKKLLMGKGLPEFSNQDLARALMTGFILAETDKKYAAFRDDTAELKRTLVATKKELVDELPENADIQKRIQELSFK
ncbi:alpha/beta hydrolase [Corynebacterium sp. 320]|uniref:Alpha/beta hydrolase n=1 Tax=Corynebacterium zhongnanshanii TaxID=2768834 RepID=A0ABQ6VGR3_9CORY|nr:alpha/beta hydrolase [Corynebacterium sp. 320]KAB1553359.1 alpha/beta hydrolase [Corynebacterium sp. 321]KAB1554530.1 alpha/beta hydrolase [Corynebacterium sp. 319]KAB3523607.1 alpha/beta hydrolase [Corynebacterium zhongnanshanii]KAB3528716.1 alpha/beta hydrolase [Corynebacterium sp. 250]KAB3540848.1 alpha/beta hydrolase [Corynebacterium sp. 366]MCR5914034.1 alpha/beta hydrolase [Corynebacterium sp. zg254]